MKIVRVAKMAFGMLKAPLQIRRNPASAPVGAEHYVVPELASGLDTTKVKAREIPVASTPQGRWKTWPPMVLAESDEPLVEGAPDIRGVWQAYKGPMKGHIERNEQAGDRVVITAAGIIHDMYADGTLDGGVNDEGVGGESIAVAARYEAGRLNLYLNDKRLVVTRYLDGDDLVWRWGPYTSRLRRIEHE